MLYSRFIHATDFRSTTLGIALACILLLSCGQMPAQSSGSASQGFLQHLILRGSGGLTAPVGGTGGIMNQGWNVGLGTGYEWNSKIGVLLDWQFNRAGIGNNVLQYNLVSSGSYHLWTVSADPTFTYWHRGKISGYAVGGGGFSRTLVSYDGPGPNGQCYSLCTCYNNCSPATAQATAPYHYSSNQPSVNAGLGFSMRILPSHLSKLYVEARYENLFENSLYPPFKHAEIVPLSLGVSW